MCGVAGIISLKDKINQSERELCVEMTKQLTHRGPNQQGVHHSDYVSIGNTRLSIIDRNIRSQLPMSNNDQSVWISYNGEVSNFIILKDKYDLESKYHFKGQSDTEVVLYLYHELGIDFLSELTGMFAFSIIDYRKKKAYIVRDFYGINPMFYTFKNDKIFFASEIKSLLEIPGLNRELNKQGLYHYFTLAYYPGTMTPFKDVEELRNGELIEINLEEQSFDKRKYYELTYTPDYSVTEQQASKKAYELMLDSVERNLISDAPIGTTLSGGVDTSTLTCLVKDLGRSENFQTFSLKMGEKSFDESSYQQIVANYAKTEHHEILVSPDTVLEAMYKHMAYIDEPCGDGSAIPSYILSAYSKKHVDVLLSGEGGDEVFNAYSIYGAYKIRDWYTRYTPKSLRDIAYWGAHKLPSSYKKLSFDFQAKRFTEGSSLHPASAHIFWRHVFTDSEKHSIFMDSQPFEESGDFMIKKYESLNFEEGLSRVSFLDFEHFFVDDLMVKNDRMFMANSIETRFPYMDRPLVEYMTTVPADLRLKGLKRRHIQKQAMRNSLPKEILQRSNFGLEMPHSIWFFDKFRPIIDKYINKETIDRVGLFNWEFIQQIRNDHYSKKRDYGRGLWCLLLFLIWHEMYFEKNNYKDYQTNLNFSLT